jgi:hypothetical protein
MVLKSIIYLHHFESSLQEKGQVVGNFYLMLHVVVEFNRYLLPCLIA